MKPITLASLRGAVAEDFVKTDIFWAALLHAATAGAGSARLKMAAVPPALPVTHGC